MRSLSLLVCAAGLAACYHPKIQEGSIFCSDDPTPKCPSGMRCAADGRCYVTPPVVTNAMPYGDGKLGGHDLSTQTGVLTLHTNTGQISLHDAAGNDTDIVPAPGGPFGTPQTNGPPVAFWSFTDLSIPPTMQVVTSPDSVAIPVLAATGTLTMGGIIDLSGSGGENGGAGENGMNPFAAGSGGGGATADGGGGGGGHAVNGSAGSGNGAGAPGPAYGTNPLPVFFGSGGGGGSGSGGTPAPGFGGNGGGAIALLGSTVDIEGSIDVSGLDGLRATAGNAGGGGGGAGGTILVSGATVTIGPGAMLTANGGKGGGGLGGGGAGGGGAVGIIRFTGNVSDDGTATPRASIDSMLPAFPQ